MEAAHRAIDAIWRIESSKLIAGLTRIVRDVGIAEDLAQDALIAALQQWPSSGVPDNPAAWLMATAKHKALDMFRRTALHDEKVAIIARDLEESAEDDYHEVPDDLLRLILIACHPVVPKEGRVALTLRLLGGLSTPEIARAFLVPEPTVAQRIVRAKKTLADANIPFETPDDLTERLASVLEVIYLIFNEGYAATTGDDWMRPALCEDAIRLARVLAGLLPREADVHGLLALMELQASRTRARTTRDGTPILLMDQDRSRWDRLLIAHGLAALEKAERLGGGGSYTLQAAIAACHARAQTPEQTDWREIAGLYAALEAVEPTPVVVLNRAVATAMAGDPAEGLALTERLLTERTMQTYYLLPAARGDLLERMGRRREARDEFLRAAQMTSNEREKVVLSERAAHLEQEEAPPA